MVEVLINVLQSKHKDNEHNIIQMANVTSQSTQILTQLLQKMQKMQTFRVHTQTQLNNTNKNGGNDNNTSDVNKSEKVQFLIQLYFWNHGACNHQGGCCRAKS